MVKMIFAAVVVALLAINVNAQTTGDCSTMKCEEGEVCIMQQVQCFTTPCPPLPTCVKKEAACSGNETWTECGTCEQKCGLKLRACTKRCQPARCECVHSKGFMRDEEGHCIKKEDCPKKTIAERSLRPPCPANQTWVACSSRCPATCEDKVDKKLCITACGRPKCQCSAGYVLSGELCLLPEDCPITRETRETDEPVTAPLRPIPKCSENETLHQCGAACDSKCGQEQMFCPMICLPPACRCAEGFARNSSGTCVKKVDCTAPVDPVHPSLPPTEDFVCPKDSELNPCGNHCERKCGQEWPRMCIKICGPKACVCSEGLARHADGRCVPVDQCDAEPVTPVTEQPKECKGNETYSDCGTCEATCANGVPQVCAEVCRVGCTCEAASGFARNAAGECIYMEDCPGSPVTVSCRMAKCAFGPCRMQVVDCDQPPCWPQPVCPQPTLTTLLPKSNTPL